MTRNRLSLTMLVALTTVPALVLGVGLWGVSTLIPQCAPQIVDELPSPDGANTLTTFSVQCGLDTASNIQAAVHPATSAFDQETAAVFITAYDTDSMEASWADESSIAVRLAKTARVTRRVNNVSGISVIYE
ncbi:hypothetical protein GCM10007989_09510 [Devosia pacifica]|uniref:Uncharacterized protein n=1 Tax=Devosia pacifica TaxID=1335967 RepID=A0A918VRK7_9HYPH|nr:hypothetical protein [Devosia pacifica]GHA16564.1 hypothetical protein GCM10007989_09510 [Devosia pacifica]